MSLMIFDAAPLTWQQLEAMVCQAFDEMGYKTTRNAEISTARGTVRADVHAIKISNPIPTQVLCECKYWNKPVEQSVIHGFRSVCSDAGAHYGLIISKVGFQSGANKTRSYTNIHLLDFDQFQRTFYEEWRNGIWMRCVGLFDSLIPIIPIKSKFVRNKSLQLRLASFEVFKKYEIFFGYHNHYTAVLVRRRSFPIRIIDPRGDPGDLSEITIETPRQYFDIAQQGCADARAYFDI